MTAWVLLCAALNLCTESLKVLSCCCTFAADSVAFIPNPKLPALLVVIRFSRIFSAQNVFTSFHRFDPSALACHSSYACSNMPVFMSTETAMSTASTSEIAAFVSAANNCPSSTCSWRACHPSWRFQSAFIRFLFSSLSGSDVSPYRELNHARHWI